MRVGYLVPEFPSQTHAFFWREQHALSRIIDFEIPFVSTSAPPKDSCLHAFAAEARARTTYLVQPKQLAAGAGLLAARPSASRRVAARLMKWTSVQPTTRMGLMLVAGGLAAWAARHQIDHLHVHSAANSALLATLAFEITGLSHSYCYHGGPKNYGEHHDEKAKFASAVFVDTPELGRQVVDEGWTTPNRVHEVSMGVDTDRFAPGAGWTESQPRQLLTVARLVQGKGIHLILEAIARLRSAKVDVKYRVIGEGPYGGELAVLTKRLGIEDVVEWSGTGSEDDVIAAWRQSYLGVAASLGDFETTPVALKEAMALGVPCVASRVGGVHHVIDHEVNGLMFEEGSVEDLTAALSRLLTNTELRERMSQAARATAEERFDSRRLAERLHAGLLRAVADPVPSTTVRS